jgi:subtilisin family serine protease
VVAILDTGCGVHPWLADVVREDVMLDGAPIGYTDPDTDPESHGDLSGPLDGALDPLAGHGTFIAGLVHQACPDADILSWRVVPSDGIIVESDLIDALTKIAELVRRHAAGEEGGQAIDVLSLSMGYYHETPEDQLFDPTMYDLLELMGESGTVVVASAGNDATARPMYPAAFAPWSDGGGVAMRADCLPVLSVGALNPDDTTAMFSNVGPWVSAYQPGAAVVSTMPPLQGGYEPIARTTAFGRERESIDPDDFTGGFAVWSGTSFSAPLLAGRIALQLLPSMPAEGQEDTPAEAVARGWKAVEAATGITAS